jgi:hypothetical protein
MADSWRELVAGFDQAEPPLDLQRLVEQREAKLRPRPTPARTLRRPAAWIAAAAGAVLVVAALALAAHSRSDTPTPAPVAGDVIQVPLTLLRQSFAPRPYYKPLVRNVILDPSLGVSMPRPQAKLASDRTLDSAWVSETSDLHLIWKSGVAETVRPFTCACTVSQFMSRFPHDFRRLTVAGEPAIAHVSMPRQRGVIGPETRLQERYGVPASVELIRQGMVIVLYRYGAHALPGLIEAAKTIPAGAADAPKVTLPQAIGIAQRHWGQSPARISALYLPNGTPGYPVPLWVIYLIGGKICLLPHMGPGGCASHWIGVNINATTGKPHGEGNGDTPAL